MKDGINILILSCGTRNKVVQYFKEEVGEGGRVFAADCSRLAPALYDADKFFHVPRMDDPGYLEEILCICKENKIDGVFSLIDPELSLLAENRESFLEIGTLPIVSEYDVVELAFDKYKMHRFLLDKGFNTIKTYIDRDEFYRDFQSGLIDFPVFIKPIKGSASINIHRADSKEDVEFLLSKHDDLMIQDFMDGVELGADVYIDMISGQVVSIFIKEKLKMRAGETDKSVSIKDGDLFDLIEDFVKRAGFKGIIDIDIFKKDGLYYISEVNPRFGGGYLHGHEMGVNVVKMIVENIKGNANENTIGQYEEGKYMMKYNEVRVI